MATRINPVLDGTFARASQAWLGEPDGMKEFAVDARRVRSKLLVSDAEPQAMLGKGPAGVNMLPVAVLASGRIIGGRDGLNGLYVSDDSGESWTATEYEALVDSATRGANTWGCGESGVIAWRDGNIHYSLDGGDTWAQAQWAPGGGGEGDFAFLTANTTVDNFSFAEHHGTLLICEYSSDDVIAERIYRSVDGGATWAAVHRRESPNIRHWHAVGYHVALGRWVAAYGDGSAGTGAAGLDYSDDDGVTWAELSPSLYMAGQPVALLDYGHPTRMLAGSDFMRGVCSVNVDGDSTVPRDWALLDQNTPATGTQWYCFHLAHLRGMYYANVDQLEVSGLRSWILASSDGETWTAYCDVADATVGGSTPRYVRPLGIAPDGRIHAYAVLASGAWRHITFRPAVMQTAPALLLEPTSTNQMAANLATGSLAWTNTEVDSTQGHHSTESLKVNATTAKSIRGAVAHALVDNKIVQCQWWARGRKRSGLTWKYRRSATGVTLEDIPSTPSRTFATYSNPLTGAWERHIHTPPFAVPEFTGGSGNRFMVIEATISVPAQPAGVASDLRVDSIKVSCDEPLTDWVPGATTRAADSLLVALPEASDWTLRYDAVIGPGSLDLPTALGEHALFSLYDPDIATYALTVLYEPVSATTGRLVLRKTTPGGDSDVVGPTMTFPRNCPVAIIIRKAKWTYRWSLRTPAGVAANEAIGQLIDSSMESHTLTLRAGLRDGTKILPHWFCGGEIEPVCLSDADVTLALRRPTGGLTRPSGGSHVVGRQR